MFRLLSESTSKIWEKIKGAPRAVELVKGALTLQSLVLGGYNELHLATKLLKVSCAGLNTSR